MDAARGTSTALATTLPNVVVNGEIHNSRTRYFVITSNNTQNVVKSVRYGLWATQRKNEDKLDEAYRTAPAVVLVFSVNRSEAFQGYARMRSPVGRPSPGRADPFNGFGKLFEVEWLRLYDLQHREVDHLKNPLNGDKPVHHSRDGQEVANAVGQRLCSLIDRRIDSPEVFLPPGGTPRSTSGSIIGDASGGVTLANPAKRLRTHLEAPNPISAPIEEQMAFFGDLDYDEYVKWWQKVGASHPGPTLPTAGGAAGVAAMSLLADAGTTPVAPLVQATAT